MSKIEKVPILIQSSGKSFLLYKKISDTQLVKPSQEEISKLIKNGEILHIPNPHKLPRRWINFLSNEKWCSIVGPLGEGYAGSNLYGNVYWGYYDDFRGRRNESGRYMFVRLENGALWNVNFIPQRLIEPDKIYSEFSPAYVKFVNETKGEVNLRAEIIYFVPSDNSLTEIWYIKIKNLKKRKRKLEVTFGFDGYIGSRKFEVYHHLVTGLYNEALLDKKNEIIYLYKGIKYEEGETIPSNQTAFFKVISPVKTKKHFFADEEYFLGNYYNRFNWGFPLSLMKKDYTLSEIKGRLSARGVNVIAAVEQEDIILAPHTKNDDSMEFIVLAGATLDSKKEAISLIKKFNSVEKVKKSLQETINHWKNINSKIKINTPDKKLNERYNNWYTIQNYLRKRWGNTGSLYHDYGIDNFGWRDLWQDWLGWMYIEPDKCEDFIPEALIGTRLDGSTASGFKLDEKLNLYFMNDPEKGVWCDHPFWPTLTVYEFLTNIKGGDFSLLLKDNIPYIRDIYRKRATSRDPLWLPINKIEITKLYGTVFEHLWLQIISMFYAVDKNTGFLNQMRAGWDDALDQVFGANVPFTMAFVWGANMLADMLEKLEINSLEIYSLYQNFIGNSSASTKKRLKILTKISKNIDKLKLGKKIKIKKDIFIKDLRQKAEFTRNFINEKAWDKKGKFYIGYYDSNGNPIDYYKNKNDYKLHLTPQAFALLSKIVPEKLVNPFLNSIFDKLWDKKLGGLILNTPYDKFYTNIGRKTQFAKGTKEHSAKFTHMSLMFMAGLLFYKKGNLALKVWEGLAPYKIPQTRLKTPDIWLPEYLISSANPEKNRWNQGEYEPLTASPAWARKIFSDWVFGIRITTEGYLVFDPVIPDKWKKKKNLIIEKNILNAYYKIEIIYNKKSKHNTTVDYIIVDGKKLYTNKIKPFKDGKHNIKVYLS